MKSACCLLLLFTLVPSYQTIRCHCDQPFCENESGPEEECPDRLGAEYYAKHANEIKEDVMKHLPEMYHLRETIMRLRKGESISDQEVMDLMPKWKGEAENVWKNLSNKQKAAFYESYLEFSSLKTMNKDNIFKVGEKLLNLFHTAFNLTSVPNPVNYQFCMTMLDGSGKTVRACGLVFIAKALVGTGKTEVGCHDNPLFDAVKNDYPKYCRCDADLCNSEDIEDESLPSKIASTRISTCLLLVVMLKTFVV